MSKKILIVEDELIEAMNFESFINSSGFDVVGIATTGEETLEKIAELKPDLVLMDIVLKGDMDGIETAALINEEFDIPVVYITAHPEESVVNRAKITTPYGYLIKPINKTNLKNTIELALYKHNMEIKLKESEKKFRYILENSLDAAYRRNLKIDKYDYLSPVIEKILGYSVTEFISMESKKVIELVHPKDRLNINEIFENAISGKTNSYSIEYRIKHKNGEYKWINDFGSIVKDENNLFLIGSVRDISEIKQSGEDLRESEEFLDSIVDNIPYMIFVKNADDLSFKRVNKVGEEYFGHPGSELIGKNDYEFFPKNEADFFTQKDRKVLESGELLDIPEETIETKKLGPRLLHTKKIPINDKKGNPQYLLGISEDITERKRIENQVKKAEKELQKSEKRYRELVDYSLVAMYETTLDGEILFANDAMVKMFDYESVEDLKAVNIVNLYKNAEDWEKFLLNLKKHENLTQYEVDIVNRSGKTFNALINAHLIDNHITGMIIDISKVKRAEDALRESELRYRTLFESDPDYTMLISSDGVLLDVNPAAEQITGFSKEELVGKNFINLGIFPKDELVLLKKHFPQILHGDINTYEGRIIDKDGLIRWVHNSFTPVMRDNEIDYMLIIGSDITERKYAEEEIKASLKDKEILLKEIHHRVKNNLQIISSLLELQETFVIEDPTAVNVLHESQNRVQSMALIHEMLYQSKDLSHISFLDYIMNLVSNLFTSYGEKMNIKLTYNIADTFFNIETSIPLGLIISELVSNSLKYAFPDGKTGEITTSLQCDNTRFELIISDNGIGLPEDIDIRNIKSSLGLQLVNSLVNQLDGTIKLDRSQGTKYTIKFKELKYEKRV